MVTREKTLHPLPLFGKLKMSPRLKTRCKPSEPCGSPKGIWRCHLNPEAGSTKAFLRNTHTHTHALAHTHFMDLFHPELQLHLPCSDFPSRQKKKKNAPPPPLFDLSKNSPCLLAAPVLLGVRPAVQPVVESRLHPTRTRQKGRDSRDSP